MEGSVEQVEQVQKRLYHNNTGGWLGVVLLDHKGEEHGDNVEPYGDIWLSDAEAILTARAPRRAEDNPFAEQAFVSADPETGRKVEVKVRPLVLVEGGDRYVPAQDRYVPGINEVEDRVAAQAAAHAAQPQNVTQGSAVADRAAQVEREGAAGRALPEDMAPMRPVQSAPPAQPPEAGPPSSGAPAASEGPPPPAPPAPVAAPAMRSEPPASPRTAPQAALSGTSGPPSGGSEDDARESWVSEPEAPGRVLQGALGGSDEVPAPADADSTLPQSGDRLQGAPQAATQTPGAEEHAAVVDPAIGEETGQARPPAGEQPQGEYARAEEVGSPDAPQAGTDDDEPLVGA